MSDLEAKSTQTRRIGFQFGRIKAMLLSLGLAASLISSTPPSQSSVLVASCDAGFVANVEFLSSPVFPIDIGNSYLSQYIGYKVTATVDISDLWVKITPNSGSVTLAPAQSNVQNVGPLTTGNVANVFFLASVPAVETTTDSVHIVSLYDGDPNGLGTELCSGTGTFTEIVDTLSASANKVTSINVSTSGSGVGNLVATVTVLGQSGIIPADGDWLLSPTPSSNFPADKWRLIETKLETNLVGGTPTRTYNNILYIDGVLDDDDGNYRATFKFRLIASVSGSTALTPISYITSGGPLKFTGDLPAAGAQEPLSATSSTNLMTFDSNGGDTPTPETISLTDGDPIGALPTVTRTGYTFNGWFTSPTGGTQITTATVPSGSTTYYAQWTPISLTVTFNSNYGTPTTSTQTVEYNVAENLDNNTFTRTGYTFLGWSTDPSATTATYANGASFTATADTTLYAVWRVIDAVPAPLAVITFDPQGGSMNSPSSRTIEIGRSLGGLPSAPTRYGYEFVGWSRSSSSFVGEDPDQLIFASATFFAIWKPINVSVTWDSSTNGGSGFSNTSSSVLLGTLLPSPPSIPSRPGYEFLGWFNSKSGGDKVVIGSALLGNQTYYAQWKKIEYQIDFIGVELDKNQIVGFGDIKLGTPASTVINGEAFLGWNIAGKVYKPGQIFTLSGNAKATAVFAKLPSLAKSVELVSVAENKNSIGTVVQRIQIVANESGWKPVLLTSGNKAISFVDKGSFIRLKAPMSFAKKNVLTVEKNGFKYELLLEDSDVSLKIANINFKFAKYSLTLQSRRILDQVAKVASDYGFTEILFKGHTDARKGPTFNNLKLSRQRANAAKNYVLTKLSASMGESFRFKTSFVASNDPVYLQDDAYARSVNRRVEITLSRP